MKQYKYKISLATKITPLVPEETDKYLSIASKSKLKDFLPSNVDFGKKIDFLGFSGEFCTVNRLNGNDDAIQTKEALEIAKLLPFSFIDTEHSRKAIIGVITSAHFNEFGSNKVLSEDDVKGLDTPFNISVAGIIWRLVNPDLAEYIEVSGEPNSDNYGKIFLSWELLFDKTNLIEIDVNKRNIKDGDLITDESAIEKLEGKLKANGGRGFTDTGKRLGRIPVDEIIPAGCALTENPAGEDLKPISILSPDVKLVEKDTKASFTGFSDTSTKEAYSGQDKSEEIKNKPVQKNVTEMVKNETKSSEKIKEQPIEQNNTPKQDPIVNKDLLPKTVNYKFGKCPGCGQVSDYNSFIKHWNSSEGNITCPLCSKRSSSPSWEFNENNIWKGKETAENVAQEKKHKIIANINNENTLSHLESINVNKNNKTMKISSIKDITDENLKECKASDITEILNSEIKIISDSYLEDKKAKDDIVKTTTEQFNQIKASNDKVEAELKQIKANYDKMIEENNQKNKLETFSARMSTLDDNFDLTDKEKAILGSKIKAIDKDEDFTKFLEETEVLLAAKKKAKNNNKMNDKNDKDDGDGDDDGEDGKDGKDGDGKDGNGKDGKDGKKSSKASQGVVKENIVAAAIDNGKKEEPVIANSVPGAPPSLKDRMANAFNKSNWATEDKRKNRI